MKAILLLLFVFVPFFYLLSHNAGPEAWSGYCVAVVWMLIRLGIHS
jgi:hypothetical protein